MTITTILSSHILEPDSRDIINTNFANLNNRPLSDLADITITTPADNEVLTYEAATGLWKNKVPAVGTHTLDAGQTDVVITTPADNEVLAFHAATSEWINQTAAEAGLSVIGHTHLLSAGATDVTATAAELNLLDLATLTVGHTLRAISPTSAAWQQLLHTDLGSIGANDHHAQSHILDGADHTASGLTAGHFLRANSATTFGFAAIGDADIPATLMRDTEHAADPHVISGINVDAGTLFVNAVNNRVGIGTTSPEYKLEVAGGAEKDAIMTIRRTSADTWGSGIYIYKRGTTGDANAAVVSGTELGYHSFYGWDGSAWRRGAYTLAKTTENWTGSAQGTQYLIATTSDGGTSASIRLLIDQNGNVGIGTTGPTTKIDINGQIRIRGGVPAEGKALVSDVNGLATWRFPKRTIILTAAGGWPSTTAGCAANAKVEYVTNDQDLYHLDFNNTTRENAQWTIVMPDSYDGGTITAKFIWTSGVTTGDVVWGIEGRAYGDNEAIDAAWGAAVTVTDTATATANSVRKSAVSTAITLAGTPAGGEVVQFRVFRDAGVAGDSMVGDARLIGVLLEYTLSSYSD